MRPRRYPTWLGLPHCHQIGCAILLRTLRQTLRSRKNTCFTPGRQDCQLFKGDLSYFAASQRASPGFTTYSSVSLAHSDVFRMIPVHRESHRRGSRQGTGHSARRRDSHSGGSVRGDELAITHPWSLFSKVPRKDLSSVRFWRCDSSPIHRRLL
jgi:hypothetical protein